MRRRVRRVQTPRTLGSARSSADASSSRRLRDRPFPVRFESPPSTRKDVECDHRTRLADPANASFANLSRSTAKSLLRRRRSRVPARPRARAFPIRSLLARALNARSRAFHLTPVLHSLLLPRLSSFSLACRTASRASASRVSRVSLSRVSLSLARLPSLDDFHHSTLRRRRGSTR